MQLMNDRSEHSSGHLRAKLGELVAKGGGRLWAGWKPPCRWLLTGAGPFQKVRLSKDRVAMKDCKDSIWPHQFDHFTLNAHNFPF